MTTTVLTRDQRLVAHIRDVLKEAVANSTDTNLLQAYACWHVHRGQHWDEPPPLLDKDTRAVVWSLPR
jgi:hypothetical protein